MSDGHSKQSTSQSLQVGDQVSLVSGGTPMTVVRTPGIRVIKWEGEPWTNGSMHFSWTNYYTCQWMNLDGELREKEFPRHTLVRIGDSEPRESQLDSEDAKFVQTMTSSVLKTLSIHSEQSDLPDQPEQPPTDAEQPVEDTLS